MDFFCFGTDFKTELIFDNQQIKTIGCVKVNKTLI